MKRKLVKQGAATLMISLPSKWIKANKLDKGDEIDLEEDGKILKISSNKTSKEKEIIIEINEKNIHDLRILLTHSYRKGFDKITIKSNIGELANEVNKICSAVLLGFEVVTRTKDKIILENISQPDSTKYLSMLSKVFLLIEDMPESIIRNLENGTDEIKDTKDQCDKFILFCRRIITESKIESDPILEWEFLTFLTHIQHSYFYLYEYAKKNKINLNSKLTSSLKQSKEYFSILTNAYLKKDLKFIAEINYQKNKFAQGGCLDLIASSHGKEAVIASYLREIFRLIQIASSPVLSEILEKEN